MPNDDAVIYLYATAPDATIASALAETLVEAEAAACVNILPGVSSVYRWRGAIETSAECALLIKTTAGAAARARDLLLRDHPYETPAIVALPIEPQFSSANFLRWIAENVRN
jgi:periplasmic divalent cation tolerance protein